MLKPFSGSWSEAQAALRSWYQTDLGRELNACITARISALLAGQYALHCLQVGGTQSGADLLAGRGLIHRLRIAGDRGDDLWASPVHLPLATTSIDLVLLCHTLEFCDDPHGLLREIDRILKLDGRVLTIGFNPWSLFGARRLIDPRRVPWTGRFYSTQRVEDWLALLDVHTQRRETVWVRPPVQHEGLRRRLGAIERLGNALPGNGGVYLLLGRKRSTPFTLHPVKWERPDAIPAAGRVITH